MNFHYTAMTPDGVFHKGDISAKNEAQAKHKVRLKHPTASHISLLHLF